MAGRSGRGRRAVRGAVAQGKPSADSGSPMRMSRMTRTQEAMVGKLGEGEPRVLSGADGAQVDKPQPRDLSLPPRPTHSSPAPL